MAILSPKKSFLLIFKRLFQFNLLPSAIKLLIACLVNIFITSYWRLFMQDFQAFKKNYQLFKVAQFLQSCYEGFCINKSIGNRRLSAWVSSALPIKCFMSNMCWLRNEVMAKSSLSFVIRRETSLSIQGYVFPSFDDYRIIRINNFSLCPENPNWKIARAHTIDHHCFYLHKAYEWVKRIRFEIHPKYNDSPWYSSSSFRFGSLERKSERD